MLHSNIFKFVCCFCKPLNKYAVSFAHTFVMLIYYVHTRARIIDTAIYLTRIPAVPKLLFEKRKITYYSNTKICVHTARVYLIILHIDVLCVLCTSDSVRRSSNEWAILMSILYLFVMHVMCGSRYYY